MFEGFNRAQIDTSDARINLRHGGSGPPLLLLHGNPLTHVMWHKIAPRLAEDFTVVATDLAVMATAPSLTPARTTPGIRSGQWAATRPRSWKRLGSVNTSCAATIAGHASPIAW